MRTRLTSLRGIGSRKDRERRHVHATGNRRCTRRNPTLSALSPPALQTRRKQRRGEIVYNHPMSRARVCMARHGKREPAKGFPRPPSEDSAGALRYLRRARRSTSVRCVSSNIMTSLQKKWGLQEGLDCEEEAGKKDTVFDCRNLGMCCLRVRDDVNSSRRKPDSAHRKRKNDSDGRPASNDGRKGHDSHPWGR